MVCDLSQNNLKENLENYVNALIEENFKNPTFHNIKSIDEILDLIYNAINTYVSLNKLFIPTVFNECYDSNKLNKDISSKKVESCQTTSSKLRASAKPFNFKGKVPVGGSIFKIKHSKKTKKQTKKQSKNITNLKKLKNLKILNLINLINLKNIKT